MKREYEAEVVSGLEDMVEREIRTALGRPARLLGRPADGRVAFQLDEALSRCDGLRLANAVHLVDRFDVPRPRALLGHEHMTRLISSLRALIDLGPKDAFQTFRVSAAGVESAAFTRLRGELARELGLEPVEERAHLLVSVRRPPDGSDGWQVLTRTTPMPLSARSWRVCDYPGALNATVAHAMAQFTRPVAEQRYLNLACGSATLLIERLMLGPASQALGVDAADEALRCAQQNLWAAGFNSDVEVVKGDITSVGLPDGSVNAVVGDLPYGMLSRVPGSIQGLYESSMAEATRVTTHGGRMVVITARKKLFRTAMGQVGSEWVEEREITIKIPFKSGFLTPSIWVFRRQ
jgi:tRNA (guanine6-N2)-methyltransferase